MKDATISVREEGATIAETEGTAIRRTRGVQRAKGRTGAGGEAGGRSAKVRKKRDEGNGRSG